MRPGALLLDERGQSLVFVALALGTLITILALVVSVGDWTRTRQRAQSVADAAALAGAQDLPDQTAAAGEVATSAAQNDWPGASLQTAFPDASSIQVVAQQDVTGFFAPLAGVFDLTIKSQARASVGTPATVTNVVPVAVKCNASCSEWSGSDTFTFDQDTPGLNTLVPLQLPGIQDRNDFKAYVQCDVQNPDQASCNQANATAPASYPLFVFDNGNGNNGNGNGNNGNGNGNNGNGNGNNGNGNGNNGNGNGNNGNGNGNGAQAGPLRSDLQKAEGPVHLIPVFDTYSSQDGYHVVGWAVGTFSVDAGGGRTVTLNVSFQRLIVDGTSLPSGSGPKPNDFGVRAIALTG